MIPTFLKWPQFRKIDVPTGKNYHLALQIRKTVVNQPCQIKMKSLNTPMKTIVSFLTVSDKSGKH